jgi:cell shape-determining protein MreC
VAWAARPWFFELLENMGEPPMPLTMQRLRFNHVYGLLLLFCAATAFLLPRFVDPARAQFQNIYAPISRPSMAMAQWLHARLDRQRVPDAISPESPRSDTDIRQENLELHQSLALLTHQLEILQQHVAERAKLGTLADLCTAYSVSATDTGTSETLLIGGGNFSGLAADMAALYPGGLAGRLQTPGLTGTRVRLITDRGFRLTGVFVRFIKSAAGHAEPIPIATGPVLVTGESNNTMLIEAMPLEDARKVHVDDWVQLADSDKWPPAVQGELVGRVVALPTRSRQSPGFAEVRLEPAVRLMQLHELMIVDKAK